MNLRHFTIAMLVSALPLALIESPEIKLLCHDFIATEKATETGEKIFEVKLSKSGKAKIKSAQNKGVLRA